MKKFLHHSKFSFTLTITIIIACLTMSSMSLWLRILQNYSGFSLTANRSTQNHLETSEMNSSQFATISDASELNNMDTLSQDNENLTNRDEDLPIPDHDKTDNNDHIDEDYEENEDDINQDSDGDDFQSDETFEFSSDLIIKAVNPGYTIDKASDVGELIELQNLSDSPISLAGFSIRYTNTKGKETTLVTFPDGSLMAGEYLLIRYKKVNADIADMIYTSASLAMTGTSLELIYNDEVVDRVCWTGKDNCTEYFTSTTKTTLVRDLISGEFAHQSTYETHFDPEQPSFLLPLEEEPESDDNSIEPDFDDGDNADVNTTKITSTPKCYQLEFSEILTYYAEDRSEQFIELYNPSSQTIELAGCQLKYKNKTYDLNGVINPDAYFAYYPENNFSLTKNPTTSNSVMLLDVDGQVVDELVYPNGQKKSMSYAKFYDQSGNESWQRTYSPTPGAPNQFQEFKTCPVGKVINPLTGNCVNATSLGAATTQECPAGKYRNPLTGRCKNIETASAQKECAEGYERNPETNRCRKIVQENDGAEFALVPNTRSSSTIFIAFGIVACIVAIGVVYIVLQFRYEIIRATRKARQRLNHVFQDLFSSKIGRNRNKKS